MVVVCTMLCLRKKDCIHAIPHEYNKEDCNILCHAAIGGIKGCQPVDSNYKIDESILNPTEIVVNEKVIEKPIEKGFEDAMDIDTLINEISK